MSTRTTLTLGDGWHLYEDCRDDGLYIRWTRPPLEIIVPIPKDAIAAIIQRYDTGTP
jgi:hypothetical protein